MIGLSIMAMHRIAIPINKRIQPDEPFVMAVSQKETLVCIAWASFFGQERTPDIPPLEMLVFKTKMIFA